MPLIEIKNIVKTYTTGEDSFNALNGVSFSVEKANLLLSWEHQVPENQRV